MKVQQATSGAVERDIVTGMITHVEVLAKVAPRWDGRMFASPWCDVVGALCVEYHRKHGGAPGRNITTLFERWAEQRQEEETSRLVERFLESLSGEYERNGELNTGHLIDMATDHFNRVKLGQLKDSIEAGLDGGDLAKTLERVTAFHKVQVEQAGHSDLRGGGFVESVFARRARPLVEYPDALGHFFGPVLARGHLVAFEAPEKTGKTWWLMDLAYRAAQQKRRVAFFEVGDMTEEQMAMRLYSRTLKHPYLSTNDDGSWPCAVPWPQYIHPPGSGKAVATVDTDALAFDRPLDLELARAGLRERGRALDNIRLVVHPACTVSVLDLTARLEGWAREGWPADVVVIDYADILAPVAGKREARDEINETWVRLAALAKRLHCLVVTASQTDTDSYDRHVISRKNFSGDKRKRSHVDGTVGINVTAEEKRAGLCRLNWVMRRDGAYDWTRCVHVAGCLPLGNPAVRSTF